MAETEFEITILDKHNLHIFPSSFVVQHYYVLHSYTYSVLSVSKALSIEEKK